MRYRIIILALLLAGCTSSHYVQVPGNTASQEQLDADQHECVHKVMKQAAETNNNTGTVVGGVLLGPIGAIVGDSIANKDTVKPDYNVEIEKCMADKGYTGVSSGYN